MGSNVLGWGAWLLVEVSARAGKLWTVNALVCVVFIMLFSLNCQARITQWPCQHSGGGSALDKGSCFHSGTAARKWRVRLGGLARIGL
jgi:hypothetical protein